MYIYYGSYLYNYVNPGISECSCIVIVRKHLYSAYITILIRSQKQKESRKEYEVFVFYRVFSYCDRTKL